MPQKRSRLVRILRVRYRRALVRLDRDSPWLRTIPSWGSSVLLHAVALVLMAVVFYSRSREDDPRAIEGVFSTQLAEDLTSLKDSDHAGDPFTTLQTPEPPSLTIEPAEPDLKVVSQPALPSLARFAPELAGPELPHDRSPSKGVTKGPQLHSEAMIAPFSGRQGLTRAQLVRREGGTVRSEKAVEEGIDWLIRHQRGDGGWSLNYQGQCRDSGCSHETSIESDTAATGLSLLPLLGAGHIHSAPGRYRDKVREGLDWLIEHQKPTGDLFIGGGSNAHMYSHAIATMVLCEAYGISRDPRLREPAQKAIGFIVKSQHVRDGGWRYTPGQSGDTSVFGWQMFALRSARLAGLKVSKKALKGCRVYLDLASTDPHKATYSYQPGAQGSPVMTAEALLCRQYLGWPHDSPSLIKGVGQVAAHLKQSGQRNIYYWYYATQLLHNMQNKDWPRWNVKVRDGLVDMQVTGTGCDRGSWDPLHPIPDRWARTGGRLYLTSLSLLTLEVYYRYLPLYRPSDTDRFGPEEGEAPRFEGRDAAVGGADARGLETSSAEG